MQSKNSSGASRTRNYATVVYPDSAVEAWQQILADQCIPVFISPLHDQDINPNGEPKKPHYHVLIMFENLKTREQAQAVFGRINGIGCEVVQSLRGYSRYLCHLDNPEKHQYAADDVKSLCGADYMAAIGLPTDKYKAIGEMMEFIVANDIYIYSDLLDYARINRSDWFRILCDSGTLVIKEYLKSRDYKRRTQR